MIIISWDVGVIHLAYCILECSCKGEEVDIEILDWDEINLIEDERIKLECCGELKAKKGVSPNPCGKNATYYLNLDNKNFGFCKTHLSQHNNYWSTTDTKKLFKEVKKQVKHVRTPNWMEQNVERKVNTFLNTQPINNFIAQPIINRN